MRKMKQAKEIFETILTRNARRMLRPKQIGCMNGWETVSQLHDDLLLSELKSMYIILKYYSCRTPRIISSDKIPKLGLITLFIHKRKKNYKLFNVDTVIPQKKRKGTNKKFQGKLVMKVKEILIKGVNTCELQRAGAFFTKQLPRLAPPI